MAYPEPVSAVCACDECDDSVWVMVWLGAGCAAHGVRCV